MNATNTGNSRTITSILVKTLALRVAVIAAQANLYSLQGRPLQSQSLLWRILLSILEPLAPVFDFVAGLYKTLILWIRYPPRNVRFAALQLFDVHVPIDGSEPAQPKSVPLRCCREDSVVINESVRGAVAWVTWVWRSARVIATLVVLAQSVSTIFLVIRRFTAIEQGWLLIDFWNCVTAVSGSSAAFVSLLIISFSDGRSWIYLPAAVSGSVEDESPDRCNGGLSARLQIVCCYAFSNLFENRISRYDSFSYTLYRWVIPKYPGNHQEKSWIGFGLGMLFWVVVGAPHMRFGRRPVGIILWSTILLSVSQLFQWGGWISQLYGAAHLTEPSSSNWTWGDPLSDQMFVY